jgi:hypothetical protein
MNRTSIKNTAETVLRELPSVLGAYVSEDTEGNPREVHVLVRAGPDPASLARDLRGLLQERLGIPIDQRVISIAQLAAEGDPPELAALPAAAAPAAPAVSSTARPAAATEPTRSTPSPEGRAVFSGIQSSVSAGQATVSVQLEWQASTVEGVAEAADTSHGRARAAATATLRAAMALVESGSVSFELDFATVLQALDGEYALVSVLGVSQRTGRRPLTLVGAQPVESDVETAAAFATLKAINRLLGLALP